MGRCVGDRTVPKARGHDEQIPWLELHRLIALELDPELSVPAEEEFVLVMAMPRELSLEPGYADDGVVDPGQVFGLPGSRQRGCRCRDADFDFGLGHASIVALDRRIGQPQRTALTTTRERETALRKSEHVTSSM